MCCLRVPLDSSEGWQWKRQESERNAARRLSKTPGDEGGISVPWTLTPDTIQGGSKILKRKVGIGIYICAKILEEICYSQVLLEQCYNKRHGYEVTFCSGFLILGSVHSGGEGEGRGRGSGNSETCCPKLLLICWYSRPGLHKFTKVQKPTQNFRL